MSDRQAYRRQKSISLLASDGNVFNGRKVGHNVLSMAFQFSNDLHLSTQSCMTKRLELPQQAKWQERTMRDFDQAPKTGR